MYIKIQISDAVYKALVASGKRKRGSIALISPKEGNFNAFSNNSEKRKQRKFIRLAGTNGVGEKCRVSGTSFMGREKETTS